MTIHSHSHRLLFYFTQYRGNTCLHMAAVANACNALQYLLSLGKSKIGFDIQNYWGETALHLAASGMVALEFCKLTSHNITT